MSPTKSTWFGPPNPGSIEIEPATKMPYKRVKGSRRFNRYPKRTNYTRAQVKSRRKYSRKKTWVMSLADPCNIKGVKIPDDHVFPTLTKQIKIISYMGATGAANGDNEILEVNPADLRYALVDGDATSEGSLIRRYRGNSADPGLFVTQVLWNGTNQSTEADVKVFHQSMAQMRVVSACSKAHYIGNSDTDKGIIIGGLLRGNSYISVGGVNSVLSYNQFEDSVDSKTHSLREGIEVKWVPSTKNDTEFEPLVEVPTLTSNQTSRALSTGYAIAIRGVENGGASNLVRVTTYINVEYIPKHGVSGGTTAAHHSSAQMSKAAEFAASPDNFVTTPHGTLALNVTKQAGAGAVGGFGRGIWKTYDKGAEHFGSYLTKKAGERVIDYAMDAATDYWPTAQDLLREYMAG